MESKKRGLSLEEKRERILQIFYESQDFFRLEELEKLGPKKGVIAKSVKYVVQSLVDDDLVSKEKIGTSVYFWTLPSCAGNQLRNVHQKLESDLQNSRKRFSELVDQCNELKKGREKSEQMGVYADYDPATIDAMKKAINVAHKAANRWTKNIFLVRYWCSKNFPRAKEQIEHMFKKVGITDDFQYVQRAPASTLRPVVRHDLH